MKWGVVWVKERMQGESRVKLCGGAGWGAGVVHYRWGGAEARIGNQD